MNDPQTNNLVQQMLSLHAKILNGHTPTLERQNCERQLGGLGRHPQFAIAVLKIVLTINNNFFGCFWATQLKNFVTAKWVDLDERIRSVMRNMVLQSIKIKDTKMVNVMCAVVGEIAHHDFPEKWPNLLAAIVGNFQSCQSVAEKVSWMKCMRNVTEYLSTEQRHVQKFPGLIKEMMKHCGNKSLSGEVRYYALKALWNLLRSLEYCMEDEEMMGPVSQLIGQIRVPLFQFMCNEVALVERGKQRRWVKLGVLQCLLQIVSILGPEFETFAGGVLEACLMSLRGEFSQYSSLYVNNSKLVDDPVNSESAFIGLHAVIVQNFEVLTAVVTHPYGESKVDGNKMLAILDVAFSYLQLTTQQMAVWRNTPQEYVLNVEDEYEDSFNVRRQVEYLFDELENSFGVPFVACVFKSFGNQLQKAKKLFESKDVNWWKVREAALLGLGLSMKKQESVSSYNGNMERIVTMLLRNDLNDNVVQHLQSRAAWLLGRSLKYQLFLFEKKQFQNFRSLSAQVFQKLLPKITANKDKFSFPLKIEISRTITRYLWLSKSSNKVLQFDQISKDYNSIIVATCSLMMECNTHTAYITIDALNEIIRLKPDLLGNNANLCQKVMHHLFKLYIQFAYEPLTLMEICRCFESLMTHPNTRLYIMKVFIPEAIKMIKGARQGNQQLFLFTKMLQFINNILKSAQPNDCQTLVVSTFKDLYPTIMQATDNEILQCGTEYLRHLVYLNPEVVKKLTINGGATVLKLVLDYLKKMLEFAKDGMGNVTKGFPATNLFGIGKLLNGVFSKFSGDLSSVMPQILNMVIFRVVNTININLTLDLLMVFIKLFSASPQSMNNMINFLSSVNLPPNVLRIYDMRGQTSALSVVLFLWIKHVDAVQGEYARKLSLTTFVNLLLSNNQKLAGVQVPLKGQAIVKPAPITISGYATRSKVDIKQEFYPFPLVAFFYLVEFFEYELKAKNKKHLKDNVALQYFSKNMELDYSEKRVYNASDYIFFQSVIPCDDEEENEELRDHWECKEKVMTVDLVEYLLNGIKRIASGNVQYLQFCQKFLDGKKKKMLQLLLKYNNTSM